MFYLKTKELKKTINKDQYLTKVYSDAFSDKKYSISTKLTNKESNLHQCILFSKESWTTLVCAEYKKRPVLRPISRMKYPAFATWLFKPKDDLPLGHLPLSNDHAVEEQRRCFTLSTADEQRRKQITAKQSVPQSLRFIFKFNTKIHLEHMDHKGKASLEVRFRQIIGYLQTVKKILCFVSDFSNWHKYSTNVISSWAFWQHR